MIAPLRKSAAVADTANRARTEASLCIVCRLLELILMRLSHYSNLRCRAAISKTSLTGLGPRVASGGAAYVPGIEISSRNWRSESMRIS